jgi:5'-methylthioadenosine nucleosidase
MILHSHALPVLLVPSHSVMINIAMEAEAKPFIEHMGLALNPDFFPKQVPFLAYEGMHGANTKVTCITNGKDNVYNTQADNIGTVSASMATFLALQKEPADMIINAGTCGGFRRKGAAIGDVFLTTAVAFHDRRIPLPEYDRYGVGKLETMFDPSRMAEHHNFKTGVCTTGNSLDQTQACADLMLANDATVKDMEAASIAWTAKLHDTPFLGVKVVTDIVDGDVPTHEEFMENLATASTKMQEALPLVLDYVSGKEHHEL